MRFEASCRLTTMKPSSSFSALVRTDGARRFWNADAKHRLARNRFHVDLTPMLRDDSHRCIQAETRSVANAFSSEKRIKDAWQHVGRNAGPIVLDFYNDIERILASCECQLSTFRHRVNRVDNQVRPYLVQLDAESTDFRDGT